MSSGTPFAPNVPYLPGSLLMAHRTVYCLTMAAMLAMGCDVSQKTPQTGSLPAPGAVARPAAANAAASLPEAATGEKSIRLFGPGVSRKRQTRV